ncbi:Neuropeptide Y receptor [Trichinella spiralis]|uniref:Neuropeptide Y receptor n=1 Tax=Trichinella spiralis TaxID=6334 RepID=A0A0V1BYS8_TRISP|nr:Neuropeptide Y receptor [Trichinella spiralis]
MSSNSCIFSSEPLHEHIAAKVVLVSLYVLVFVTALIGNLMVVGIIVFNRRLQSVTNFFICNLAVSDIFVTLTSLWLTPMYGYLGKWIWGAVMCHSLPVIQGASIFINSFTLTAIALDRYIVILNPFKKRMKMKVCFGIILAIWILSLLLVAPYGFHMDLYHLAECDIYICRELWEFHEFQAAYGFSVMALQFGIPFLIITVCYLRIWFHIFKRKMVLQLKSDQALQRRKRLLKMLTLMVAIFGLCWLPFNVLNILRDVMPSHFDGKSYFVFLFLVSHLIAMSSSSWNTVLYAWMNYHFNREFRRIFSYLLGRRYQKKFNSLDTSWKLADESKQNDKLYQMVEKSNRSDHNIPNTRRNSNFD